MVRVVSIVTFCAFGLACQLGNRLEVSFRKRFEHFDLAGFRHARDVSRVDVPHNSGHYTLDACDQSQFDLQVRALAGLPLLQPRQHSPAIMLNLLGDLWFKGSAASAEGAATTPDWAAVLALPGVHLHLYGKLAARAGRKMGHLTVTGEDLAQVRSVAAQAADRLGIILA